MTSVGRRLAVHATSPAPDLRTSRCEPQAGRTCFVALEACGTDHDPPVGNRMAVQR
jgi:hypothetical protein